MNRLLAAALAAALLSGCSGDDLKKQLAHKDQLLAAQEAEIRKIKDDMGAREADLKAQCEQRVQKLQAQHRHQVEGLNARISALSKGKDADHKKTQATPPARSKNRG